MRRTASRAKLRRFKNSRAAGRVGRRRHLAAGQGRYLDAMLRLDR